LPADKKKRAKKARPPPTPPQPKAWDMPPLPARGDPYRDDTFIAVGRALSQWEHFEGEIGLIYGILVDSRQETEPAMRAYGAVSTFSTRLDMILSASKAFFLSIEPSYEAEIKSLLDDAKQFASRRNEIAHGIVQPYYIKGSNRSGYALGPSKYATRKQNLSRMSDFDIYYATVSSLYAYTSTQLSEITNQFGILTERAMEIYVILYHIAELLREKILPLSDPNKTGLHCSNSRRT
jgi:hypothetical protein